MTKHDARPKSHWVRTVIISIFSFHVNLKMSKIGNWTIFYRIWGRFIHSEKPIAQEEPEGLGQDWTLSDVTLWTALILVTTIVQTDGRMNEMKERRTDTQSTNIHFHPYSKRAQIYLSPLAKTFFFLLSMETQDLIHDSAHTNSRWSRGSVITWESAPP